MMVRHVFITEQMIYEFFLCIGLKTLKIFCSQASSQDETSESKALRPVCTLKATKHPSVRTWI